MYGVSYYDSNNNNARRRVADMIHWYVKPNDRTRKCQRIFKINRPVSIYKCILYSRTLTDRKKIGGGTKFNDLLNKNHTEKNLHVSFSISKLKENDDVRWRIKQQRQKNII